MQQVVSIDPIGDMRSALLGSLRQAFDRVCCDLLGRMDVSGGNGHQLLLPDTVAISIGDQTHIFVFDEIVGRPATDEMITPT